MIPLAVGCKPEWDSDSESESDRRYDIFNY